MARVRYKVKGDLRKTRHFLEEVGKERYFRNLDALARKGVDALSSATPYDSGLTADSWSYEISRNGRGVSISWLNTNINNGVNIAVILQYGHGTGTGGYVQGRNYINPAIQPIMDEIAEDVWKEVKSNGG